ncbi:MAG: hypothetical protein HY940_08575 [Gammaproteobacteria bacterium]|nr:hypothetical protein [Gammaproteobacteria bacterium]
MTGSLGNRVLVLATLILITGLGATALSVDRAYIERSERATVERLQGHLLLLVAALEEDGHGQLILANPLPEQRFFTSGSGLYAAVRRNDGVDQWRSPSAQGITIRYPVGLGRSEQRAARFLSGQDELQLLSLGIGYGASSEAGPLYTFSVAEDRAPQQAELEAFRRWLWGWFAALAVLLLATQLLALRWLFRPLRNVAQDLQAIQDGWQQQLPDDYPEELRPLVQHINALVAAQQQRLGKTRSTLGDLAHSLKTPLAVLRGTLDEQDAAARRAVSLQQIERMSQLIEYQLQRAATAGHQVLVAPVLIAPAVSRIIDALAKVYRDRHVDCQCQIDEGALFHGDEGDLLELLGNVLDNAYKWCGTRVRITARQHHGLELVIDDDGPGIDDAQRQRVLDRGIRGDASMPGHGLGLAIVAELVAAYHGTLDVGRSEWGGAQLRITIPLHQPAAQS